MARGAPNIAAGAAQRIAASIPSSNARQRVRAMAAFVTKIRSRPTVMQDSRSSAIGVTGAVRRKPQPLWFVRATGLQQAFGVPEAARRGQRRVGALTLCLNQAVPCPSNASAKARHGGRARNDRKATRSGKHRGRHRCGARNRCAKADISRGRGRLELCSQPHESGAQWWMCPR
jgi:hypothetical protein